jgi:hypothetical protein
VAFRYRQIMVENPAESPINDPSHYKYYLGDLAVARKAWFYWDPDRGEPRNTYISWLDDDARHIGVSAGDEGQRIAEMSIRGVTTKRTFPRSNFLSNFTASRIFLREKFRGKRVGNPNWPRRSAIAAR